MQGPQLATGSRSSGGSGRNKEAANRARSRDLAAERLRAEQQEAAEGNARAARGPRAASKFIGVTWRERIQRWEVGGFGADVSLVRGQGGRLACMCLWDVGLRFYLFLSQVPPCAVFAVALQNVALLPCHCLDLREL